MPDDEKSAVSTDTPRKPTAPAATDFAGLGLKLSQITDQARQKYKLDAEQKGVVITEVASAGEAADHGLKVGDVVVEVAQVAVSSPADMQKKLEEARSAGRKSVLLLVQGQDGLRWVPLPVPKKG
jgi:serine protease Do